MKNPNNPAYPLPKNVVEQITNGHYGEKYDQYTQSFGLTKREAFAMAAMQGLLSNPELTKRFPDQVSFFQAVAVQSKYIADDVLNGLEA